VSAGENAGCVTGVKELPAAAMEAAAHAALAAALA
jgi:hypothetical protein